MCRSVRVWITEFNRAACVCVLVSVCVHVRVCVCEYAYAATSLGCGVRSILPSSEPPRNEQASPGVCVCGVWHQSTACWHSESQELTSLFLSPSLLLPNTLH